MTKDLTDVYDWCKECIGIDGVDWCYYPAWTDESFVISIFRYHALIDVSNIPDWEVKYRFSFKKEEDATQFKLVWL